MCDQNFTDGKQLESIIDTRFSGSPIEDHVTSSMTSGSDSGQLADFGWLILA